LGSGETMILAFDTYYQADQARTVCIAFRDWSDAEPEHVYSEVRNGIAEYEPGAFYRRELPCILSLLRTIDQRKVRAIVIDGFVVLDDAGKPGLGGHLYQALKERIPVIGVAKSRFNAVEAVQREVLRGKSDRPLYVTAMGLSIDDAAMAVHSMHGEHRIPTLLKELDRLTRV
jgi:deoxyribonuclease V